VAAATGAGRQTFAFGLRSVRQTKAGQRHPGQAEAEFLQRPPTRDGLSHAFGEFIEFIIHSFLSVGCCLLPNGCPESFRKNDRQQAGLKDSPTNRSKVKTGFSLY